MPLAALTALASSRFPPDGGEQESARSTPEISLATPASSPSDRAIACNEDHEIEAISEPSPGDPAQLHLRVFSDVLARSRKPIKDAAYWRERDRQIVARACETPEAMTAYWLEELATEEVAA